MNRDQKLVSMLTTLGLWIFMINISDADPTAPIKPPPLVTQKSPEQLYLHHCAECHDDVEDLEVEEQSDEILFKVIRKGVPGTAMDPLDASISDHDIKNMIQYIRSASP
ncbi:c-type cytochrome [Magnetococcales bacterium HHB-1]